MKKTVLITGASSGIGAATARLFAAQGWNVVATMRNPEDGNDLAALGTVLVTRLDVSEPASIDAAIAAGLARFGRIDALVNNAGYGQYGLFEAISREQVQAQFDVNVFGVMDVTRAVLPHFRAAGRGVIVNVSSGAGLFTLPMISLYCASKFALEGFSEALSYELGSQDIAVKLVIPHGGVTATRFSESQADRQAQDPTLTDYSAFVARTNAAFGRMTNARSMSSDDVAAVIYGAATDGTDQLRYLVGDDARGFIKAKQMMAPQDYIDFMRQAFPPKG
ncbi:SDR family oxidoreductase [Kaistia dalseonensis]|uniref:NAD(P)-dependent dehydrogenase (Short-subunit alcohol dehydrogenase family) n=1 Tax=Kaistia dalseonensis TaxID=410840 RepID=A0ABU0HAN7_9HYPH|nr:SDR family oxidoreductase [Kaistia dalseonensis]MCX5496743.1 SDR family oxidoreductase [Kaistia dalseonensis]MDQ0439369.1 NAD(P)-dependent dehydrogenase (short-subunit alcohol dehydrogenase family) [Kaistia dalseonensis]